MNDDALDSRLNRLDDLVEPLFGNVSSQDRVEPFGKVTPGIVVELGDSVNQHAARRVGKRRNVLCDLGFLSIIIPGQGIGPLVIEREVFLDPVADHLVQPLFGPFAHAAVALSSTCPDAAAAGRASGGGFGF